MKPPLSLSSQLRWSQLGASRADQKRSRTGGTARNRGARKDQRLPGVKSGHQSLERPGGPGAVNFICIVWEFCGAARNGQKRPKRPTAPSAVGSSNLCGFVWDSGSSTGTSSRSSWLPRGTSPGTSRNGKSRSGRTGRQSGWLPSCWLQSGRLHSGRLSSGKLAGWAGWLVGWLAALTQHALFTGQMLRK